MPRFIVFTGHAGAGKTTLSKRVLPLLHAATGENFTFLDKDTLYGQYSARVMERLTGDPHDRDSPVFLSTLREPEYTGLMATARENLELGVNVIACAPFSQEVKSKKLLDPVAMGLGTDVRVSVVWVLLSEEKARARIVERAHERDRWKLAHWDAYRTRRFEPDVAGWPELLFFDNTEPGEHEVDALAHRLAAR